MARRSTSLERELRAGAIARGEAAIIVCIIAITIPVVSSDVLLDILGQDECRSLLVSFVGPFLAGLTIPTVVAVVACGNAAHVVRTLAATRPCALHVAEHVARRRVLTSEAVRADDE